MSVVRGEVSELHRWAKAMKAFAQVVLIAGGSLGLLASLPIAFYGWRMYRGFGGELTGGDFVVLYSPVVCLVAAVVGVVWRRRSG